MSDVQPAADNAIPDGTEREVRMRRTRKSRSIHVYLKPGMREDDLLLAVWDATAKGGRPQDAYRRLLLEGVKRMIENGEMPTAIMTDPAVVKHLGVLGDVSREQNPRQIVVVAPPGYPAGPAPMAAPTAAPLPSAPPARDQQVFKDPVESSQGFKPKGLDPNLM